MRFGSIWRNQNVRLAGCAALVTAAAGWLSWWSGVSQFLELAAVSVPESPAAATSGSGSIGRTVILPSTEVTPASFEPTERDEAAVSDAASPEVRVTESAPIDTSIRYFDGRPIRPSRTITMEVTAYSPDARSCAPSDDGITASGYSVWTNGGSLIAADKMFKFGTLMSVPGYNGGRPTPVLDRGGAIKGHRLDVLYPTHEEALKWGRQKLTVTIWEYVDETTG